LTIVNRIETRFVLPLVSGQRLGQPTFHERHQAMPLEAGPNSKGLRLPNMRRNRPADHHRETPPGKMRGVPVSSETGTSH
jgi:hypothetical protein